MTEVFGELALLAAYERTGDDSALLEALSWGEQTLFVGDMFALEAAVSSPEGEVAAVTAVTALASPGTNRRHTGGGGVTRALLQADDAGLKLALEAQGLGLWLTAWSDADNDGRIVPEDATDEEREALGVGGSAAMLVCEERLRSAVEQWVGRPRGSAGVDLEAWNRPLRLRLEGQNLLENLGAVVATAAGAAVLEIGVVTGQAGVVEAVSGRWTGGTSAQISESLPRLGLLLGGGRVTPAEMRAAQAAGWVGLREAPALGEELEAALPLLLTALVSRAGLVQGRVPLPAVPGLTDGNGQSVSAFLPGGLYTLSGIVAAAGVVSLADGGLFAGPRVYKVAQPQQGGGGRLALVEGQSVTLLSPSLGKKRWLCCLSEGSGSVATGFVDARLLEGALAPVAAVEGTSHGSGDDGIAAGTALARVRDDMEDGGSDAEGASSSVHTPAAVRRRLARLPAASPALSVAGGATAGESEVALMPEPPLDALQRLLSRMLAPPPAGLRRGEKKRSKGKKLKRPVLQCWEGQEAVSWVLKAQRAAGEAKWTREDSLRTMQQLLDSRMVHCVVDPWCRSFEDDAELWRFQCDGPAPPLNVRLCLARSVVVRPGPPVARLLLETALRLVRPFVRLTGNALPELDYFRLRELRRWTEFETASCELQRVSLSGLGDEANQMAFWINVHNCLCVHASVCNKGLVSGGWQGGFFTDSAYLFECSVLSLHQIHSGILRANLPLAGTSSGPSPLDLADPTLQYVLKKPDARILFALAGCYRDSPPVRICEAESLNTYLNAAAQDYLDEHVQYDLTTCSVTLPGLMQPFLRDFGKDFASVLMWVSKFLPTERRQMVAFLSQQTITTVKFTDISFEMYPPKI